MDLLKFQILSGSAQLNWSPVPATAELRPAPESEIVAGTTGMPEEPSQQK